MTSFLSLHRRQPKYRALRATLFTIVACYAFFFFPRLYLLEGFSNPLFSVIFWYMMGMGGTYIFGAVLYGSRFPEKYSPGLYDYAVRFVLPLHSSFLRISFSTCVS